MFSIASSKHASRGTPSPFLRLLVARSFATESFTSLRKIEALFGSQSFGPEAQSRHIPASALDNIKKATASGEPISDEDANAFAQGLQSWAIKRGVTHYTHMFHPLTADGAQKHEALLKRKGGRVFTDFSGKALRQSEPDASSFPNGGLRQTHEARGYTVWDPTTPPYVLSHSNGATLMLPSMFLSWTGDALDFKIPLLRSEAALNKAGRKLFKAMRVEKEHTRLSSDVGAEQEFFLIERDYYLRRPDIMATGRSLLGAPPPKGQSLSDQYFGDLSVRMLDCIHDAEMAMWKLGIPQTTRHREVSPGQYEIAPIFDSASITSDMNRLVMDLLHRSARKYNLKVLFHEKPFAHLNGSGKHNNWSVGTDSLPSCFEPGDNPATNRMFLTFAIAMIRACDLFPDLLRISVASCSNDHRLGGHEAPPAIMSVYLGDEVNNAIRAFVDGKTSSDSHVTQVDLGVLGYPSWKRDTTDRNRTSPIAFTGNKFEFRAVGSAQSVARSSYTLNAILADSLNYLADEFTKATAGKSAKEANAVIDDILRKTFNAHKRVCFEGDNYSQEWQDEAARRGLPNLVSSADALPLMNAPKNVALFESLGIFSKRELHGHQSVVQEEYVRKMLIESSAMVHAFKTHALPAGIATQTKTSAAIISAKSAGLSDLEAQASFAQNVTSSISAGILAVDELQASIDQMIAMESESLTDQGNFAATELFRGIEKVRHEADAIEASASAGDWTLPSYNEMLFHQD